MHGAPIARDVNHAIAIAQAASETRDPKRAAAELDVFAALETNYGAADVAGGCPRVRPGTTCARSNGAKYCSPWMMLCSLVPIGSTLLDEARIAIRLFDESARVCPRFPLSRFVGVGCHASAIASQRAAMIEREASR